MIMIICREDEIICISVVTILHLVSLVSLSLEL